MKYSQRTGGRLLNIRQMAIVGVLAATTIVLGLMGLGFLVIPGLPLKITIMHIPVIIGAIIEGPLVGAMVGLLFGIFSVIQNMMVPTPLSFALLNPLVSVLPRVVIGIMTYYVYKLVSIKGLKAEPIKIGIAAAVGTATNTVGVLGMIYLLYAAPYAQLKNIDVNAVGKVILGIAVTNGIPEIIAAVIITIAVVMALKKMMKK